MSEEQTPTVTEEDQAPEVAQEEDPCGCTVDMAEWIEGGTEEECRPCLLPPVVQWYREELEERGLTESVEKLTAAVEEGDPLALCQTLDEIREAAPEEVGTRLRDFDCAAQTFEGDIEDLQADVAE